MRSYLAHSAPLARDQADKRRAPRASSFALERPTGRYVVLQAPTHLGLRSSGVALAGDVLLEGGLATRLGAAVVGRVEAAPSWTRDPATGLCNGPEVAAHARRLADALVPLLEGGAVPLVLGGDDSVLVGAALALRRLGRHGLLFLDAHVDFTPPTASPTGELSDTDLAIVTGHGPPVVGDIEGLAPYFVPDDVVALGRRDFDAEAEDRAFAASGIRAFDLPAIRRGGLDTAVDRALDGVAGTAGVWIHLDCDVFADDVVPAVDYRTPGGLLPGEVATVLRRTRERAHLLGITVTIYNPTLDPDRSAARAIVDALVGGLLGRDGA